jgi:hypothetical protein
LRRARADQIADHDQPGGDADPHLEGIKAARETQAAHLLNQGQARPHSLAGLVFMSLGVAEVGEHTIAHVLGNKPLEAADGLSAGSVIGAEHIAIILGVQMAGQLR